jgi:hypothetical protein
MDGPGGGNAMRRGVIWRRWLRGWLTPGRRATAAGDKPAPSRADVSRAGPLPGAFAIDLSRLAMAAPVEE